MNPPSRTHTLQGRAALALLMANLRYWPTVLPHVRRQLRRWEQHAEAIEDPRLRAHACAKLRDERFNTEVASTLATLAPRSRRRTVIQAIVALQVMYDYLDALGEEPVDEPLRNGRQLFSAFTVALGALPDVVNFYRHHPNKADNGYLQTLAATCRHAFRALPSAAAVASVAVAAAERCGEAQTRTHAIPLDGMGQLRDWAACAARDSGLTWWEYAAGGAASILSVHALIAAAAEPRTTPCDAVATDAAYLTICALSTLLDSLIDQESDIRHGSHSFVTYYPNPTARARGISTVARRSVTGAIALRHGPHHLMTAVGVAAFYLSSPGARTPVAHPTTRRVRASLSPLVWPTLSIFRVWRVAKRAADQPRVRDAARPPPPLRP